jgi:RNA polymerase sigma-70 factor (ECF subfamily)
MEGPDPPPPEPAGEPSPSDAWLLDRVRRGAPGAWRAVFERHGARVWRFLRAQLGDRSAADEGTQETFVRAHQGLLAGTPVERLLPWLLGIARNVAWEQRRQRARTIPMEEPVEDGAPDASPDPEALLLAGETRALLTRALARLGDERRAALLLRIDQGLDYGDIATVLGWSVARVRNELHRGRSQLRLCLVEELSSKEDVHAARV